jgi:hypothetical protein
MARKTHVVLIDDLDGSEAADTVTFGLDGANYEIDLSAEHAAELRETLEPWTSRARRVGGRTRRTGTGKASSGSQGDTALIRAWAKEQGHEVSERGRISKEIREAYEAARG